jgi:hypothetical protein
MPSMLINPVNFEISIPSSGSQQQASSAFGVVEFASAIDNDLAYWAGREFALKVGGKYNVGLDNEVDLAYSKYATRYRFVVRDIEYDEEQARVIVLDGLEELNNIIQQSTYSGSGTYGGTTALTGQYIPCVYGKAFNVPCVLIDDSNYIYQLNDGVLADITDVRVNGKSWSDGGDTTDLPSWGGGAATYKTDLSRGLFRLGAQPGGLVTADAERSTTQGGLVCLEVMQDMGITNIDIGSWHTYMQEDLGFYCGTSGVNALSLINDVVTSTDSFMYSSRIGLITLGGHQNPREGTAELEIKGLIDDGVIERQALYNGVHNNSDLLDAEWSDFNTPITTQLTGEVDPMGSNKAFNIETDQAAGEARQIGVALTPLTFERSVKLVLTTFFRPQNTQRPTFKLLVNSGGWTNVWATNIEDHATTPHFDAGGLGTVEWWPGVPAGNGWWFLQARMGPAVVAGAEYALRIFPNIGSAFPRDADFAYPCLYESRGNPAYPVLVPFESYAFTNTSTGNSDQATEGNVLDVRTALAVPAWIISIRRIITPPAPKSIKVAYQRNWSTQNEDSLDTSLSQTLKQKYSRANISSDIVTNDDAAIINPKAKDLFIGQAYIATEIDANAIRDGIAGRVGAKRDLFQIEIVAPLFQITVGMLIKIYHHRFNLEDGKTGEVLRIIENATTTVLDILVIEDL